MLEAILMEHFLKCCSGRQWRSQLVVREFGKVGAGTGNGPYWGRDRRPFAVATLRVAHVGPWNPFDTGVFWQDGGFHRRASDQGAILNLLS